MFGVSACEYSWTYYYEPFKYKFFCVQVKWKKSDVKFEDRFDKYLDPSFFQHRVCILLRQPYKRQIQNGCFSSDDVLEFLDDIFEFVDVPGVLGQ